MFEGPCIAKYTSITVQQDAKIYSLFIIVNCSKCFDYLPSSSAAHITVSAVSGIIETVLLLVWNVSAWEPVPAWNVSDWEPVPARHVPDRYLTGNQFSARHVPDR
jgi:hypothetical protein